MDKTIQIYQEILRRRFPTVTVRMDPDIIGMLNALCIPDDEAGEYVPYLVDVASWELEKHGINHVCVIPFTVTDTKTYYPEDWAKLKDSVEPILKDRTHQQVLPPA